MRYFYKELCDTYLNFSLENLSIMNEFYKNIYSGLNLAPFDKDCIAKIQNANQAIFSDQEFLYKKLNAFCDDLKIVFMRFHEKINDFISGTNSCEDSSSEDKFQSFVHPKDKRFSENEWNNNPFFDLTKEFYGAFSKCLYEIYNEKKEQIDDFESVMFFIKQFLDALAPSNIPMLNPTVIKKFLDTGGESLVKGLKNLLYDISEGRTLLNPTTNDTESLKPGKNLALTKGKVVFQNDMMQLIQYVSTTSKNFEIPILIIPPWINKFYIMDLSPTNSFVKWLVDSGFTVFIISWVNPDSQYRNKSFEDYIRDGLTAALDKIHTLLGVQETNVVGYCLGGTLMALTQSILNHPKSPFTNLKNKIKSGTFIATLTDFSNVGDFALFANDSFINFIESLMEKTGYLDKDIMFKTFNLMKANDMIWSTVVNNYLLGNEPKKLDVLSWNSDTTNMPYAMHSFLLRNMYQKNLMCKPNGIKLFGVPINLKNVKIPSFIFATEMDHIAPWTSAFATTNLLSGPTKFVLGGSGHVAGVINSINKNKYYYYTNNDLPKSPNVWLKGAKKHMGSWWQEWHNWIKSFAGKEIQSRIIDSWLEESPGRYVMNFVPRITKS